MNNQKEGKSSVYKILGVLGWILAFTLGGYIVVDKVNGSSSTNNNSAEESSSLSGMPGNEDFDPSQGPGPGGMFDASLLVDEDTGELNYDELDEMKERSQNDPFGMFSERIESNLQGAVDDGDITQDQAEEILEYLLE